MSNVRIRSVDAVPPASTSSGGVGAGEASSAPPRWPSLFLLALTAVAAVIVLVVEGVSAMAGWNLLPLAFVAVFLVRTLPRDGFDRATLTFATVSAVLAVLAWTGLSHLAWVTDWAGLRSGRPSGRGLFFVIPLWSGLLAGVVASAAKLLELLVRKALGARL